MLSRLKDGYATPLGKWFDEGTELSVGQWQRVALDRAFLRSSGILVLDEPTSAMDARAEYEVFQRLHELARGRTAIIISHRLWTVRMVDRIVVLHEGRLVENGAHDELIAAGGLYARMYNLQADRFR